ncbi:hypothetical protein [Portibacter marinus]|uniref:hypothetical protein n=1 Tax=Portibacter marinus TaxID=2898660 RepID=UPI001F3D167E|nr:hypothetical protein [Portibacter marinus]
MYKRLLYLFTILIVSSVVHGQESQGSLLNLQSSYLLEKPGADLAQRFGLNSKFEFKIEYLWHYQYAFYAKGGIRINQNVKEDVFSSIRTNEGFVLGANGFYADVFGRKRGFDIGVGFDYLITAFKQNVRLGIGSSYITHWIKIVDDSQSVPQVVSTSGQFYDRFVSGVGIEENVQFQYNIERAAFLIGIQFGQFFTKEHRFMLNLQNSQRRLDLYYGIKLTYLLPLIKFGTTETIYY